MAELSGETKVGPYQLAILVLTVTVLLGIVADTALMLPPEASRIVHWVDNAVCVCFFIDFSVRFRQAESKLRFLKWGWIDLLASIPNVEFLRWGRMVRVLRIIRLLRGVRSVHKMVQLIYQNRLQGGMISGSLIAFLLVVFASVAVLVADQGPEANFQTAEEALWWSVTTITTVGYGDKYPVSTEGRLVGMLLMICGVGLFGLLSGSVASLILGKRDTAPSETQQLLDRFQALEQRLNHLATESHAVRSPEVQPAAQESGNDAASK